VRLGSMVRAFVLTGVLIGSLVIWGMGADKIRILLGSHMDYLMDEAKIFEERFGIAVEIDLVTTPDLRTKLVSAFIARRSPWDVVFLTAALCRELAEKGWVVDLTERANELWGTEREGLVRGSFEAGEHKGRTIGIPVTIGCPILIWNKALVEEAGLDPERPYEWHRIEDSFFEFLHYARVMTQEVNGVEYYGFVDAWGGANHSLYFYCYLVQALGGDVLDADDMPLLTSDECLHALLIMVDMYKERIIDPACVTYTWCFDSGPPFWEGTRGMIYTWPFMVGVSLDPTKSKIADHVGWAPMPAIRTSAGVDGSEFLGIPTYASNPDLGWEFIAFVTSKEMQERQGTTSGWIPIWEDLLVAPSVVANQPYAPAVLQSYQYPTKAYRTADFAEWASILQAEVLNAVLGKKTPEQALADAQADILKIRQER